jgi:hypothetical protein
MGQYYMIMNLDKKEYIDPHAFGDGLKLLEFGSSGDGAMCGLAILLADGNNRGGGDLHSDDPVIGSWAGDRIVIGGDYADDGKFLDGFEHESDETLYSYADVHFTDISKKVIAAMKQDGYLKSSLKKRGI